MRISIPTILLISSLLLAACGKKGPDTAAVAPIKPVRFAEVSLSGGLQSKTFSGTSRSGSETKLSFRTNGLIVLLGVKVGQKVKKGQLLAKMDQKDLSLNYEKTRSSLESARIAYETAKSNLERVKELYQANSASLSDYEQAKNNYANANASYQTAKKSLALQGSQFEYARIVAPTSGVVSAVNSEVNEFAQAGSPIIIMNSEKGDMEINAGVPESFITQVKNGDSVQVSINQESIPGIITEVGFSSSGVVNFPVIVKLTTSNDQIRPGMPADVTFRFGQKEDVLQLVVPVKAVGEDAEGQFVYRLDAKENELYTCKKTSITLGPLGDNGFTVMTGLKAGELVATAGLRSLYEGREVRLLNN